MEAKDTPTDLPVRDVAAKEVELELGRSRGDYAPLRRKTQNSVFSFENISFTVSIKKEKKVLLSNISGELESGHVLAVMGPSGAGKTTLINALTLNGFGGETRGVIKLDGEDLTAAMMRARGFVVAQQDNHWPFLTCRETLAFAADFYLDVPANERKATVESIIEKMGLVSCADTTVGNEFVQGLSGGQKRRLSIGIALIKQPDLIVLDEPTSGLDAAAAANIMAFIKELAEAERLIILATIHQPSSKVYEGFDQVMILSKGRMAYQGDADKAVEYFASIGHSVPPHTNQADHFLDLVNADFTEEENVVSILDTWEKKAATDKASGTPKSTSPQGPLHQYRTPFSTQIAVMMRRQFLIAIRDPLLFLGRAIMIFFANLYFAIIYIEARDRNQDQVVNKFWLMVWYICVPANMGVVAVYAYNAEFKAVRREVKNGMVSPLAYLCANALMQIPLLFAFGFFALGIPAYAVSNFWGPNFGWMLLVFSVSLYTYECFAQLFSVLNDNPLLGMMNFVSVWFNGFLFGGFLIPLSDIVWPFRALGFFFPLRYCMRAMSYVEFIDTTYEECSTADSGSTETCDANEICYGDVNESGRQDGGDVLNSLEEIFNITSDENTLLEDILINLGVAIFLKICYMMVLNMLVKQASTVLPHSK